MKTKIEIKKGEFKPGHLLKVLNIDETYTINTVTEKAVMVETDNGRWGGGGFEPLWLPISQMTLCGVSSTYGIHKVRLPEWLITSNKKKW